MTIRDLQYAIQDAIDEKGVCDNARVRVVYNKDMELEIFAIENRLVNGTDGKLRPYYKETLLGRV